MASQVVIKPTFLLKGINPYLLNEEYNKRKVLTTLVLEKKKISTVTLVNNRGKSFRDATYTFKNKDNFNHVIATTNVTNYIFMDENGKSKKGGTCSNCHRTVTREMIGVPISIQVVGDVCYIFYIWPTCNFRCALRKIRKYHRQLCRYRSINLENSEPILRFVYRKMHPDGPELTEAPDPDLALWNNGSLNEDEYDDPRYFYVSTPHLILFPAKEQYIRMNNI